jgi:hypothetical protein
MPHLNILGAYFVNVEPSERRWVTDNVTLDEDATDVELGRLALLEVAVESNDSDDFDVGTLHQHGSEQRPWLERYFSADGKHFLGEDRPLQRNYRVCFFLHHFDASKPIVVPTGSLKVDGLSPMPAHLVGVCRYEHPG